MSATWPTLGSELFKCKGSISQWLEHSGTVMHIFTHALHIYWILSLTEYYITTNVLRDTQAHILCARVWPCLEAHSSVCRCISIPEPADSDEAEMCDRQLCKTNARRSGQYNSEILVRLQLIRIRAGILWILRPIVEHATEECSGRRAGGAGVRGTG